MLIGLFFSVLIVCAGLAFLRLAGLMKGPTALGLAPAGGLALLAITTSWSTLLGAPTIVGAVLVAGLGVCGLVLVWRELSTARAILATRGENRLAFGLLTLALLIPTVALGAGFAGVEVPLSSHDGAYHVEVIQAFRTGARLNGADWYPPGFHATVAAFLQLLPWVDSAAGAFGASLGLSLLAPLVVFGLGCTAWRNPLFAAAGAVVVALTFQFPYYANFWGGWPLTSALIMVVGLWTVALEYVERPSFSWIIVACVLAGGVVLTHGTEVCTAALGLAIIALGHATSAPWKRILRELPIAVLGALLLSLPYLPTLLAWAHAGGAVGTAIPTTTVDTAAAAAATPLGGPPTNDVVFFWIYALGTGIVIDAPIRAALLACGVWWALRNKVGRTLIAIALAFFAVDLVFAYVTAPGVRLAFALTYPWGQSYRLDTMVAATAALLQGTGAVVVARWSANLRRRSRPGWQFILASLLVVGSVCGMTALFSTLASSYNTYSSDDAAAMTWLRQNVQAGDVVANDGSTDAGIWIPYKAGMPILKPRATTWAPSEAVSAILGNIGQLESVPEARAAACALGVEYVYHGASGTAWEGRHFPSSEELRQSGALEQVFSSGDAAVFRTRLGC